MVRTELNGSQTVLADQILREGSADFISMGRPLLADPDLPNKARQGRLDDICSCIACNEDCFQRLYAQPDVSCVFNPRVGRAGGWGRPPGNRSGCTR